MCCIVYQIQVLMAKMFIICIFSVGLSIRTLYLMYMNHDFTTKSVDQIKKELNFCGLSKESMAELAHHLSYPTALEYVLEKNYLSGTNTVLSVLLAIIAAYLVFLVFSSSNPTSFLGTTSSVSFFGSSPNHLVYSWNQYHNSFFWCNWFGWKFGRSGTSGEIPSRSNTIPKNGCEKSNWRITDRTSWNW